MTDQATPQGLIAIESLLMSTVTKVTPTWHITGDMINSLSIHMEDGTTVDIEANCYSGLAIGVTRNESL